MPGGRGQNKQKKLDQSGASKASNGEKKKKKAKTKSQMHGDPLKLTSGEVIPL
jgi:hypothetical protein